MKLQNCPVNTQHCITLQTYNYLLKIHTSVFKGKNIIFGVLKGNEKLAKKILAKYFWHDI